MMFDVNCAKCDKKIGQSPDKNTKVSLVCGDCGKLNPGAPKSKIPGDGERKKK